MHSWQETSSISIFLPQSRPRSTRDVRLIRCNQLELNRIRRTCRAALPLRDHSIQARGRGRIMFAKIQNSVTRLRTGLRSLDSEKENVSHGSWAGTKRSKRLIDVLPTHEVLDQLAGRIEQAYGLRRPRWLRGCSTSRVWYTAALRLWEAHAGDPDASSA